jgi:hypothetical protein
MIPKEKASENEHTTNPRENNMENTFTLHDLRSFGNKHNKQYEQLETNTTHIKANGDHTNRSIPCTTQRE